MQDKSLFNQDQTSSPTISTSSIFSIIPTGISESRSFMTFDISMAYLNADMTDEVYMTLDPEMTKILLEQDPTGEFKDKVRIERVTVKLNNALYGCVQSARLGTTNYIYVHYNRKHSLSTIIYAIYIQISSQTTNKSYTYVSICLCVHPIIYNISKYIYI